MGEMGRVVVNMERAIPDIYHHPVRSKAQRLPRMGRRNTARRPLHSPLLDYRPDVTSVSTGPPPVMDLENKQPGLLGGPVERTAHRPRFGASPSLLCSFVTKKRTKSHTSLFLFWVAELHPQGCGAFKWMSRATPRKRALFVPNPGPSCPRAAFQSYAP